MNDPKNEEMSRREFQRDALRSVLAFTLLDLLATNDLFAEEVKPLAVKWLQNVNQIATDLKDQKIKQAEWQKSVEELFAKVELRSLLGLVDFDRLEKGVSYLDRGARSLRCEFVELAGVPAKIAFGRQIFALKKGRSVVPHGHNNMATGFIILKGSFHGRHYDRVEDEAEHMIIKPTIDRDFKPGEYSTVTDFKDNVHWFKAKDEPAFIFNLHILGVNPGSTKRTGRIYIDPDGEKIKDGLVRARLISEDEGDRLYG